MAYGMDWSAPGLGDLDAFAKEQAEREKKAMEVAAVDPSAFRLPDYAAGQAQLGQLTQAARERDIIGGTIGQQQALANLLMQNAQGRGFSAAPAEMRLGMGQALQQNLAAAGSQVGISPVAASLAAAQGIGQMQSGVAAGAAGTRAQEIAGAQDALGRTLAQQGQLTLGQMQQNDDLVRFYMQAGLSREQAQMQAMIEQQRLQSQNINAARDAYAAIRAAEKAADAQRKSSLIGGAFGAAGAGLGAMIGGPAGAVAGGAVGQGVGGAT